MPTKEVFVVLAVAISIISLLIGLFVGFGISSGRIATETETITETSSVVVLQRITTTSTTTQPFPSLVTINGTILTEYYIPLTMDFRVCFYGNLTGILGSAFCAGKNFPVSIADLKNFTGTETLRNVTAYTEYNGTYSVTVPNNATYDIYLELRDPSSNSTSNFEVDAIRLPVYSASPNLTNYRIGCGFFGPVNLNFFFVN